MFKRKAVAAYESLTVSARADALCLAKCEDVRTGKKVDVVCRVHHDGHGGVVLEPLARLFSGNPYNEVTPPGMSANKLI